MVKQQPERDEHLLKIRRKRVRGMVALGRLASQVPLDQVLSAFHEKHEERVAQVETNRRLNRCSGRWSLFQFTDSAR